MWFSEWEGFTPGKWSNDEVEVRDFIQKNYTPYEGDAAFLAKVFGKIEYTMDCEDTVAVVLAFFYRCGGDPMYAARLGANLGGDTDTIGALAAAICGAYSGTAKLDMALIREIEEVNHTDFKAKAVSILNL